ncbi:hypothetical protein MMC21_003250, partial [Puttea exsequens]|nr:hypothetical protein [Puttea exsequens]
MAASSYYQLDNFNASNPPSQPYSGQGYDTPQSQPGLQSTQTDSNNTNAYAPPHPVESPTKPLVYNQAAPPSQPLKPSNPNNRLRMQKFQKWKRWLRIGKTVTQALSIIFSTIMFALMVFITAKYQSTKDNLRDGRNAWPKHPKLWPTFMLLAASGITLMLSFATLLAYCCFYDKARRSWKLTVVKYVIHIGAWFVVSFLYRYEKSLHNVDNDLWGWTCSKEADALQQAFDGVVDFSGLCSTQ